MRLSIQVAAAVLAVLPSGCLYLHGVQRTYELTTDIQLDCVADVISNHVNVVDYDTSVLDEGPVTHYFHYRLQGMQYEAVVYFTFYRGDITYKHSLWGAYTCPPRRDIDLVRQFMDDIEPRLERVCGLRGLVEGSVERIEMRGCEDSLE